MWRFLPCGRARENRWPALRSGHCWPSSELSESPPSITVMVSRPRPGFPQSSAKAQGVRTMFVSGGGSKAEQRGKFHPLRLPLRLPAPACACLRLPLLSGATGNLLEERKRRYSHCPWKTLVCIFGKCQQHLQSSTWGCGRSWLITRGPAT